MTNPSPKNHVQVKPLDWQGDEYVGWTAIGVGLSYSIDDETGEEECFVLTKHDGYSELKSAHKSLLAAQEYAQSDFERRVMPFVDASPPANPLAKGPDLRALAVEIVDGLRGYTFEFSSHPSAHAVDYDLVEEKLRVALATEGQS